MSLLVFVNRFASTSDSYWNVFFFSLYLWALAVVLLCAGEREKECQNAVIKQKSWNEGESETNWNCETKNGWYLVNFKISLRAFLSFHVFFQNLQHATEIFVTIKISLREKFNINIQKLRFL